MKLNDSNTRKSTPTKTFISHDPRTMNSSTTAYSATLISSSRRRQRPQRHQERRKWCRRYHDERGSILLVKHQLLFVFTVAFLVCSSCIDNDGKPSSPFLLKCHGWTSSQSLSLKISSQRNCHHLKNYYFGRHLSDLFLVSNRLYSQRGGDKHREDNNSNSEQHRPGLLRLNKVFKATHSRRQADQMIVDGRVTVNGNVSYGAMVEPYKDIVCLDGQQIFGWEAWNGIQHPAAESMTRKSLAASKNENELVGEKGNTFTYIKYWKPRGVVCTTDRSIRGNILDRLEYDDGCPVTTKYSRLYPVGRLDKDTTGLLLLTNDGRLPNASLRSKYKQTKVYHVRTRFPISDEDLQQLRDGVVITTVAQRDGKMAKPLTAPTLPCHVERLPRRSSSSSRSMSTTSFRISIHEGRNRQIRKMVEVVGNEVVQLHRIQFGGNGGGYSGSSVRRHNDDDDSDCISLRNLRGPGDWQELEGRELGLIHQILRQAENVTTAAKTK